MLRLSWRHARPLFGIKNDPRLYDEGRFADVRGVPREETSFP